MGPCYEMKFLSFVLVFGNFKDKFLILNQLSENYFNRVCKIFIMTNFLSFGLGWWILSKQTILPEFWWI